MQIEEGRETLAVNLYYFELTMRVLMRGIKILAAYKEGVQLFDLGIN